MFFKLLDIFLYSIMRNDILKGLCKGYSKNNVPKQISSLIILPKQIKLTSHCLKLKEGILDPKLTSISSILFDYNFSTLNYPKIPSINPDYRFGLIF